MAAVQYASIEEFYEYLGKTPPVGYDDLALDAALRRMSARVTRATRLARVSYDGVGIPTSSRIAGAFSRATSAELAASGAVDSDGNVDDEILAGVGTDWGSVSLIGVSFSKNNKAGSAAGGSGSGSGISLSPDAINELANANIFTTAVAH